MDIPLSALEPELLNRIIEEFVLREGTDYGHEDFTLEQKIEQVRKQLARGQAKLVFDPESETCMIVRP